MNLYFNGDSYNHGCEAIVRATKKILQRELTLFSRNAEVDARYGLDQIVSLREDRFIPLSKKSLRYLIAAIHFRLTRDEYLQTRYAREAFLGAVRRGDICLSVGGDNYCYGNQADLAHYNRAIHARGAKTVLWGCSVEPELTKDEAIAKDLARYDLITARETISYEALKAVNPNTVLVSDPAFVLDRVDLPLPEGWVEGKMIGVNASPLILESGNGALIFSAYRKLIECILESTDCSIALIPHVVTPPGGDLLPLGKLYAQYCSTGRILLLEDHNCEELKGYIARCRFFIGARTHATIAAYSTCVPTLVAGYSVKSRGIARDIFGTEEGYVIPVQGLKTGTELADAFHKLWQREDQIRQYLQQKMPEYIAHAMDAGTHLDRLIGGEARA